MVHFADTADTLRLTDLRGIAPDKVTALNNLHEIETSRLDLSGYGRLLSASSFSVAIGEGPDAFMIAFSEQSEHPNANLAWFRQRHDRFHYVDRVIVAAAARGKGLARKLYRALMDEARRDGRPLIGCEINLDPPNPASDALHESLGFVEIGQRDAGGGKRVRYMALAL